MNFTVANISSNTPGNATDLFPLPSLTQRVISAIAMSVLIILSISGNVMVIASFYFYKKIRRSVTNCFIVSLAVCDLMVAFLSEPFWLSYQITNWTTFPKGWDINKFIMFWTILDITCAIASIVNLMFISIDRYFAIKSPLSHHTKMTPETSIWIILGLWMYSIGTGCLFLVDWKWKFLLIFVIGFLLPLVIMIFCYVGIMIVISSKARLSNQVGSTRLDKEFKTAKSLGVVTGSFVFCWLPFFIMSLLYQYCGPCHVVIIGIPAATSAVKWLHYLNSCLNPIIYAFLNPTFKVAFRNLFRKFCSNPNNFNDDMTVTTMIFPSSRKKTSQRHKSHDDTSNGRIPNGKPKSKANCRKLFRFKTPLEESLQDSLSENIFDKRVNEETYIEKVHDSKPCCSTQPNGKELLDPNKRELDSPSTVRRVHYEDEFLHVVDTDPLKMEDCSSILSDSNNNPSDNDGRSSIDSRGYRPLDVDKSSPEKLYELDLPASITDTSEISTYHDQESDQFYFYVGGEFISEKDIKTSNV